MLIPKFKCHNILNDCLFGNLQQELVQYQGNFHAHWGKNQGVHQDELLSGGSSSHLEVISNLIPVDSQIQFQQPQNWGPCFLAGCWLKIWIFIGRTDAEAETLTLWPPDVKNWLIGKDTDAGKDWRQEKGTTEDGMVGWHHWLDGHEFEQALGIGNGQGRLVSQRVRHNWATEVNWIDWRPCWTSKGHHIPFQVAFSIFKLTIVYQILHILQITDFIFSGP